MSAIPPAEPIQRVVRRPDPPNDAPLGTLGILQLLIKFSGLTSNALYQTELKHLTIIPVASIANAIFKRVWKPIAAIAFVVAMVSAADFFCGITHRALSSQLFSICSFLIGVLILLGVLVLTYLWPLGVAVGTSSVIVHERERQTWDTLLTTALNRRDIIMIKLAAALTPFKVYAEMVIWVQLFVMILIFVLIVASFSSDLGHTPMMLWELPLLFFTMIEFAIARVQDFVLAVLIGLITSLLAPTRQVAGSIALMASVALVLIRLLITVAVATNIPLAGFPGLLILISTGPSSAIAIAWRGLSGAIVLLLMIIGREVMIRAMFKWLIDNLGEANTVAA